ncbi:MAG: hypothetical protein R3B13_06770 [Polyangiaceae bacterium]
MSVRRRSQRKKSGAKFVELSVPGLGTSSQLELVLLPGRVVRFPTRPDARELERWLSALEQLQC